MKGDNMIHGFKSVLHDIDKHLQKTYRGVKQKGCPPLTLDYEEKGRFQFERLNKYISLRKEMRILDLGCGYGQFLIECQKRGLVTHGYDVDPACVELAKRALEVFGFRTSLVRLGGDNVIPFDDGEFDVIHSAGVLEFVSDIPKLFREMLRVLRTNGYIFTTDYNSNTYYDSHYDIFLIPWLPKGVNKVYLRLKGRTNVGLFDQLSFVSPKKLKVLFSQYGVEFEEIGLKEWKTGIDSMDFEGRNDMYKRILQISDKWRFRLLLKWMANFGFYTPTRFLVKKTPSAKSGNIGC